MTIPSTHATEQGLPFGSLFYRHPSAMVVIDRAGHCRAANLAMQRLLGIAEVELRGADLITEISTKEMAARVREARGRAFDGHDATFEVAVRRKDGGVRETRVTLAPLADDGPVDLAYAIFEDITAEREAARRIAEFGVALAGADDMVMTTDATTVADGGPMMVYVNESLLRETGYTRDEVLGRSATMFYGPRTDQVTARAVRHAIERGDPAGGDLLMYRKDGSAFWSEWKGRPLGVGEGAAARYVAIGRNVHERRLQTQRLSELSTAIENASDAVIVYSMRDGDARPTIRYANPAAEAQSGYTRDELAKGASRSVDDDRTATMTKRMRAGEHIRERIELRRKDGPHYWTEISASPIPDSDGNFSTWVTVERDISDLVERERTLRGLLQATQTLLSRIDHDALEAALPDVIAAVLRVEPDAVAVIDDAAACESDVTISDAGRRLQATFCSEGHCSAIVVTAGGNRRFTGDDAISMHLLDEFLEAARHNARLYDELGERRATALEANRFKDDVIAMLAHDLKNPLTSIAGFTEFLREALPVEPDAALALDQITAATQRLVVLANDALTLAQLESSAYAPEFHDLDVMSVVREAVASHGRYRTIELDVPDRRCDASLDERAVRRILDNLLSNAIKYSQDPVRVALRADDSTITIAVSDRGIGIPRADMTYIFERFTRASNAGGTGTGFGLHMVKRLVTLSGGAITVQSEEGHGAVFTVTLPRAMPARSELPRVLSIERDADERSAVADVVRLAGGFVRVARDPALARRSLDTDDIQTVVVEPGALHGELAEVIDRARAAGKHIVLIGETLSQPFLAHELIAALRP